MAILKKVPGACTAPHRAALELVRASLKAAFLERNEIVDGVLVALIARQHVLLLGPPGTAKSALINAVTASIEGARSFAWLLTKFSNPDEVLGPISLAALQQDRVARIPVGKLPDAHLAFLDEVFKSNSAVLNALLTLINERVFYNDGKALPCPLMTVIGASNELPEGTELEALFDRFMLRFWVPYLAEPRNVHALLSSGKAASSATMTLGDIEACSAGAAQVMVPDAVIDAIIAIKHRCEEQGLRSSDRRWRQMIDLLRARAYLEGEDIVTEDHLETMSDSLWRDPKDRPALTAIIGSVGNPLNARANEILDAAKEAVAELGPPDTKDASAKADWLRTASLVESRLTDMDEELTRLRQQAGNRTLRRVDEVTSVIDDLKRDVTRRVASLYRL